jgi:hypothetical protein
MSPPKITGQLCFRPALEIEQMCDYCDCRHLSPIGELSEEHRLVIDLSDELRRTLPADEARSRATLTQLQEVLVGHLRKEDEGILRELAAYPTMDSYLDRLADDHRVVRAGLLAIDPAAGGWSEAVLSALDDLAAHIAIEENDLFPASQLLIDDAGWATIATAHERVETGRDLEVEVTAR